MGSKRFKRLTMRELDGRSYERQSDTRQSTLHQKYSCLTFVRVFLSSSSQGVRLALPLRRGSGQDPDVSVTTAALNVCLRTI